MTTTTIFRVGSAERLVDGTVRWYLPGEIAYTTLGATRRHIQGLRDAYRRRGTILQPDEFTPIEITTTIHDP